MKKHVLLSGILMVLSTALTAAGADKDRDKADYYFRHGAYPSAIPYYESIVKKAPRRKDAVLHAHLADCYRLMKDPAQAAVWYARALSAPRKVSKEMSLHYGEVLMCLQKYDSASKYLRRYMAEAPSDRRAASLLRGCELAPAMLAAMPEGIARPVSVNTDRSDIGPAIFRGGLVFTTDSLIAGPGKKDSWTGRNYYNIYKASCDVSGTCGTTITQLGGKLNSKYHDGTPAFNAAGDEMYFTRTYLESDVFGGVSSLSDKEGKVHLEIMVATDFDPVQQQFKKLKEFPFNDKAGSTTHPALSPDGSMMLFASDISGGAGGVDLYMCRKGGKGEWMKPVNVGKDINTEGREMFPVFLDDRHISFASDGHPGLGGLDIFVSTWDENTGKWGEVSNAGIPVNSSWDDMSLTMYADGRNGYFSSNRPAARKSDNIYHYLKQHVYLDVRVTDSATGEAVENASIELVQNKTPLLLASNAEGLASSRLYPQEGYSLLIKRTGYIDATIDLPASRLVRPVETLQVAVAMISNARVSYTAKILDEASGQPVEDPLIVITKDGSAKADTVRLAPGITFRQSFEPGSVYRINTIKENYYSDETVITTKKFDPQIGAVVLSDTLLMCKLSIGAVCQIENILYDFGASAIRADAMGSLDKVIKLMRQHPGLKLQINSHTDCRGSDEFNMRLSNERANSVIRFLGAKGIPARRLQAKGFGVTAPVYNCAGDCADCPEEGRQKNRRTEFSVLEL